MIPGGGWFVTVTVAVWVIATTPAVAETVLDSTTVELSVPVATPLAFVAPPPVRVFPDPSAASTTFDPLIGLPNASLTVTVIVEDPVPTTIEVGCATTVDCPASGGPAVTVTTGCWLRVTPPATAVMVWEPAPVELKAPVAMPLPFVDDAGWVRLLPLPVADRVTVMPLSGLPLPSLTVTVMGLLPPAANDDVVATTVDFEAETDDAGLTMTLAVWVIAVLLIVAEMVLVSATVEVNVVVNTPLAWVVPALWLKVLLEPVDARLTLAPLIVLPLPSFAVTVIVDEPPVVIDVGFAETKEFDAETPPPPPPPDEWQAALPESVYVLPATGMNFQA